MPRYIGERLKRRHLVCATLVVVILLVPVLRARSDDQPPGLLISAGRVETQDGSEPGYEHAPVEAPGRDQTAEKTQESWSAGPIAIHLDGILCHAASAITLLFGMMQKP